MRSVTCAASPAALLYLIASDATEEPHQCSCLIGSGGCSQLTSGAAIAGTTRRYYIAANKVTWNYTPSGRNQCQGREFTPQDKIYTRGGTNATYFKGQFQSYTDATFTSILASSHTLGDLNPPGSQQSTAPPRLLAPI